MPMYYIFLCRRYLLSEEGNALTKGYRLRNSRQAVSFFDMHKIYSKDSLLCRWVKSDLIIRFPPPPHLILTCISLQCVIHSTSQKNAPLHCTAPTSPPISALIAAPRSSYDFFQASAVSMRMLFPLPLGKSVGLLLPFVPTSFVLLKGGIGA